MAARVKGIFDSDTNDLVLKSKILVVGAGGIGCELLKNLVLTGFEDIHIIDLDTIDVSNLNRQFLFQKQHVGKSKAVVAKESAQKFNSKAGITAYHGSITNLKYDVDFFRQFSAVTNALDNMAARSHVNRMCLAADIPLIESGSAGYLGQVTVYKKKVSECYECLPRKAPKTYPGCTIRNTPSEPIHCIVWAKHLFNQLFGEEDADEEVSPDAADKELDGTEFRTNETGNVSRISTREWAKSSEYNSLKIFNKLFNDDIKYLLSMSDLWKKRTPPITLDRDNLPDAVAGSSQQQRAVIKDQELWSIKECADVFCNSLVALKKRLESGGACNLVWDKDDVHCMDFVASCANLRAYCFSISQKTKFDIKAMAGNIIPAIATTNAIISGLIVLQLIKALKADLSKCKTVFINQGYKSTKKLLNNIELAKPNPKCFVCSPEIPEVLVKVNMNTLTVGTLNDKILKERLHMIAPDVVIVDGKGTILISSDPEDMEGLTEKPLINFGITYGSRLQCDDFFQHSKLLLVIDSGCDLEDQDFEIPDEPQIEAAKGTPDERGDGPEKDSDDDVAMVVDDEDLIIVPCEITAKRKAIDDENGTEPPTKKTRQHSK